jgi:hypothetical protein
MCYADCPGISNSARDGRLEVAPRQLSARDVIAEMIEETLSTGADSDVFDSFGACLAW